MKISQLSDYIILLIYALTILLFSSFKVELIDRNTTIIEEDYKLTKPSGLIFNNGIAHKRLSYDSVLVSLSKKARMITISPNTYENRLLASNLSSKLKQGTSFDTLVENLNKDIQNSLITMDLKKDPPGLYFQEFEEFVFQQDTSDIGWVSSELGLLIVQVLDRDSNKTIVRHSVYDYKKPFSGKVTEYNQKGGVIKSNWKNGLRNGRTIEYWNKTQIKIDAKFNRGKHSNYYREFYQNGQLKAEIIYDEGGKTSDKRWDMYGKLIWNTDDNKFKVIID
jgi:antitoxin component YwqK of YwqJK toxin-antitoxin module